MSSYFEGSTLFISARSPFARRVRIAFMEHGVAFEEKVLDVFQPQPALWRANPLARVPALQARDGSVLADSSLILETFYEEVQSPFMPAEPAIRREIHRWQAIALGVMEKTVEYYLETLRAKAHQDPEIFAEVGGACDRCLKLLESSLSGDFLVENGGQPTQADFDIGAALAYLRLRHSSYESADWPARYPRCASLLQRLELRPAFAKTAPPPK